jgi:hypothetical protein
MGDVTPPQPPPTPPNGWVKIVIPASILAPLLTALVWWLAPTSPPQSSSAAAPDPVHEALLRASQAEVELLAVICRHGAKTDVERAECAAIARSARPFYP